jgi:hypothetical protein
MPAQVIITPPRPIIISKSPSATNATPLVAPAAKDKNVARATTLLTPQVKETHGTRRRGRPKGTSTKTLPSSTIEALISKMPKEIALSSDRDQDQSSRGTRSGYALRSAPQKKVVKPIENPRKN